MILFTSMINGKNQRLFLIFHGRFPSEKAAALFAAKSAESFSDTGFLVTLLVPRRLGRSKEKYSDYYGIKENFKVVYLPTLDLFSRKHLNKIAFVASLFFFSLSSFFYLRFKGEPEDVIYSNETLPLVFLPSRFKKTVYEMHDYPASKEAFYRFLFKKVRLIISTNRWKKEKISEKFHISPEKILYEPNAADLKSFSISISKTEACRSLSLPPERFIVTYVGMLRTMGMEKGIDIVLKTAKISKSDNYLFLFVGGSKEDAEYYKKKAKELGVADKTMFVGMIKHSLIPLYLRSSDVLLAPFPRNDHYEFFMSPMKIFEYMMSNRPIIASYLTSIKEILNERNSFLVPPGDENAISRILEEIRIAYDKAEVRAGEAYKDATKYTWEKRAERIKEFIQKIS